MNCHEINKRVRDLRRWMERMDFDAVIIPTGDPHNNEYPLAKWKFREWLSGFTGSAGTLVVTGESAALWTDSRYFIAAETALEDTPFTLMKEGMPGVPDIIPWLVETFKRPIKVGVPFELVSVEAFDALSQEAGANIVFDSFEEDVIEALWEKRPLLPNTPVNIHAVEYAGRPAGEKLEALRHELSIGDDVQLWLINDASEIAWLLNLRGNDIPYNPVFASYLFLDKRGGTLFVNRRKISESVATYLRELNISVEPYGTWKKALRAACRRGEVIGFSPKVNKKMAMVCGESRRAVVRMTESPLENWKAIKNNTEIEGFRRAMLKDGCALVRFRRRFDEAIARETLTEMDVDRMLTAERAAEAGFRGLSFGTIAAYGPHGAIVHYEADRETDARLDRSGLLLLDSGAHYNEGTTDITRTLALGTPTAEEKRIYTLVLKGHIRLSRCRFPVGTTGLQLDLAARYVLWQEGLDYGHGTGHGVGSFLCVHEGPQQIRKNLRHCSLVPLQAGMTITDEPGIYLEGRFGVRIENTLLVRADADHPGFLYFEPLTLCPIDTAPIDFSLIDETERAWLNDYHHTVRDRLLPHLSDPRDREWLLRATENV